MNAPAIALADGTRVPAVGLGFWKVPRPAAADLVQSALQAGYRHFDCACDYGNEPEVGIGLQAAFKKGLCRRNSLWITSKLWNTYHERKHVRAALERTLKDLQLDYLDLYLVHFPIAQRFVPFEKRYPPGWFFDPDTASPKMEFSRAPLAETWAAMEKLVEAGLVKNIGVCNLGTAMLRDLLNSCHVPPAMLQIELHPYLTQEKLVRFCRDERIGVTAFSPLGAQSYFSIGMAKPDESVLQEVVVNDAAKAHGKSPAQVVLRWGFQRGAAVVPKSERIERLQENLAIFDFELFETEMAAISGLNCNRRFNDPGDFAETAFNTFCPIYD
jgi:D-xylose reductase